MAPLGLQRLLTVTPLLLFADLASDAITGRVVDPSGAGVSGVDVDIIDPGSGGNPHEQDGNGAGHHALPAELAGTIHLRLLVAGPGATRGYALSPLLRSQLTD
jgi:hypothetical protein